MEPVVIEGAAEVVTDPQALTRMLALENAKYQTDYSMELLDPAVNATIRVQPRWAFGLAEGDFTGSPTRWIFGISIAIYGLVALVAALMLVGIPLLGVGVIAWVVLASLAAAKASQGQAYRYPLTLRFVR